MAVELFIPAADEGEEIVVSRWLSPLGTMLLGVIGGRLCLADWADSPKRERTDRHLRRHLGARLVEGHTAVAALAARQLDEYFRGERREFSLPIAMTGTDFQMRVWRELLHVPYGSVISYGEQARRMGMPTATRAVAQANGHNPLAVIVPCHRVMGADGTLTGYAGGLHLKEALLRLEKEGLRAESERSIL